MRHMKKGCIIVTYQLLTGHFEEVHDLIRGVCDIGRLRISPMNFGLVIVTVALVFTFAIARLIHSFLQKMLSSHINCKQQHIYGPHWHKKSRSNAFQALVCLVLISDQTIGHAILNIKGHGYI